MPEILTESFCERCGTRYTFESAAPRAARLKGLKVVSRGLRNFVMSDDTSMDEAMAAARSETDREATSQQLDAFHKTFNFCMSCRQYTCGNCWNAAEGSCLSCAPHLGHDVLPAPFPDLDPTVGPLAAAGNGRTHDHNGHDDLGSNGTGPADAGPGPMAWPTSDLMRDAVDAPAPAEEPAEAEGDPAAVDAATEIDPAGRAATEADPADLVAAEAEVEPIDLIGRLAGDAAITAAADGAFTADSESAAVPPADASRPAADAPSDPDLDARAAAAAARTSDLFGRFRPGDSLDAELDAYERSRDTVGPAPEPEPIAAAEPEPIATAEPVAQPEPIAAAEPVAEPEPIAAAEPEPEAIAAEPESSSERADVVPQPTWRIVAPDAPTADPTADGVPAPTAPPTVPTPPAPLAGPAAEPSWPSQPEWPSHRPTAGLGFLGRPEAASGGVDALWAESAREVATAPVANTDAKRGVQPCVSCGLSLSATARFCRRCGSRQG